MSDIDSTPRNPNASAHDHPKVKFLNTREVILLGAIGGIITNLIAHPGIVVLELSELSFTDLFDFVGSAIIGAFLGGIWAFVNMPEYDRKRALQFGMIAPAVFVSFTFGKESIKEQQINSKEEKPTKQTQKEDEKKKPTKLIQKEDTGSRFTIFENAYAATQPFLQEDLHAIIEIASKKKKRKRPWWIRIFR